MVEKDVVNNSNWRIFLLCAALLILNCLWRVLVPAHEYGSPTLIWLTVLIDAGMLFGLIGLYRQFSTHMMPGDSRRGLMQMAFWPGLIAGIVIFAIRFSSASGWATGHMRYFVE